MHEDAGTRDAGFTLVEVLVVIAILGMMAAIVAHNVIGADDVARKEKARADLANLTSAVEHYYVRVGHLPDDLRALLEYRPPLLKLRAVPKDPWDHEYVLVLGETVHDWQVVSHGPDGMEGTDDDISSLALGEGV